MGVARRW